MNPWTAFAQAVVYPIARAWADAWFDAQRQAALFIEETPNETDAARAARIRAAVGRLPGGADDTGPEHSPQNESPDRGVGSGKTLRRKDG